ncbi:hypothetical protein N665_0068s0034 [Sinapis alba]|nr:hypothetical protein N665_0068s0034 [Sinapis alba]
MVSCSTRLAEQVELLMRVHHINLVSLVGYCDEGGHLALIYEYMDNGDLKQHLSGVCGSSVLSWQNRLRIGAETAQGLEYLHIGCKPAIIHRDVKATNILLDKNLQAKIGDFGLSRTFPRGGETHVSTNVAGSPGYLDPDVDKCVAPAVRMEFSPYDGTTNVVEWLQKCDAYFTDQRIYNDDAKV